MVSFASGWRSKNVASFSGSEVNKRWGLQYFVFSRRKEVIGFVYSYGKVRLWFCIQVDQGLENSVMWVGSVGCVL